MFSRRHHTCSQFRERSSAGQYGYGNKLVADTKIMSYHFGGIDKQISSENKSGESCKDKDNRDKQILRFPIFRRLFRTFVILKAEVHISGKQQNKKRSFNPRDGITAAYAEKRTAHSAQYKKKTDAESDGNIKLPVLRCHGDR